MDNTDSVLKNQNVSILHINIHSSPLYTAPVRLRLPPGGQALFFEYVRQ